MNTDPQEIARRKAKVAEDKRIRREKSLAAFGPDGQPFAFGPKHLRPIKPRKLQGDGITTRPSVRSYGVKFPCNRCGTPVQYGYTKSIRILFETNGEEARHWEARCKKNQGRTNTILRIDAAGFTED